MNMKTLGIPYSADILAERVSGVGMKLRTGVRGLLGERDNNGNHGNHSPIIS